MKVAQKSAQTAQVKPYCDLAYSQILSQVLAQASDSSDDLIERYEALLSQMEARNYAACEQRESG